MSNNLQFQADLRRFAELFEDRISTVLGAVAVALHGKLGDVTPYRSGRARASWNITEGTIPDLSVPPMLPGNMLGASDEEVVAARVVYDAIYDAKHRFMPYGGKITIDGKPAGDIEAITISSNLDYIELLNNGWSRQAPAAFFELTILRMEGLINAEIARLGKL